MLVAKRILRYVKGTMNYGLKYGRTDGLTLYGYTDTDWVGDVDDRCSTSGGLSIWVLSAWRGITGNKTQ